MWFANANDIIISLNITFLKMWAINKRNKIDKLYPKLYYRIGRITNCYYIPCIWLLLDIQSFYCQLTWINIIHLAPCSKCLQTKVNWVWVNPNEMGRNLKSIYQLMSPTRRFAADFHYHSYICVGLDLIFGHCSVKVYAESI